MGSLQRAPAQSVAPDRAPAESSPGTAPGLLDYGNAFAMELVRSELSKPDGEDHAGSSAPVPVPVPDAGAGGLPVRPVVTVGSHSQTQTADLSPYPELFGISTYGVRPTHVSSTTEPDHIRLDIEIGVETPWNVQSRGRIDIPSAESPHITRDTFAAIGNDLRPQDGGRPRRARYWAQHLSERHERFHGTDDYGWTQRSAASVATSALAGRTLPASPSPDAVRPLVLGALQAVAHGNDAYYGGEHRGDGNVPGEHRAYGDGRESYQQLYQQIVDRARTLIAAPRSADGATAVVPEERE